MQEVVLEKYVEINEDHTNENKQRLFIPNLVEQKNHHHLLHSAETQKQAEE